jgi:multidrug resistance efflux pump
MPRLNITLADGGRFLVTLVVVILAGFAGYRLWGHWQRDPWTRDARVQADVVQVTPDVSGLLTEVDVVQNQAVQCGQTLFVIDRDRYALALRQAEANIASQRAALAQAQREAVRNRTLGDLVAAEVREQGDARVQQDQAALAQAEAARDVAALNLQRTVVRAPADGFLSDQAIRVGDYVTAGRAVVGLIDRSSFRVEGYFEETKLPRLAVGQPVSIKIMGEPRVLRGHIESIASGIDDRDRAWSPNLLPSVNPTFSWVRLAQRVPVRVALVEAPPNLRLIAGRTVTVSVLPGPGGFREARQ